MLGTGNALVTRCYNTCFAIQDDDEYFLVDAGGGNGIMRQLQDAGIPMEQIQHDLHKMQLASEVLDEDHIRVRIPITRSDVIHAVDVYGE